MGHHRSGLLLLIDQATYISLTVQYGSVSIIGSVKVISLFLRQAERTSMEATPWSSRHLRAAKSRPPARRNAIVYRLYSLASQFHNFTTEGRAVEFKTVAPLQLEKYTLRFTPDDETFFNTTLSVLREAVLGFGMNH